MLGATYCYYSLAYNRPLFLSLHCYCYCLRFLCLSYITQILSEMSNAASVEPRFGYKIKGTESEMLGPRMGERGF